jgi:hypothetical protein
MVLENSTLSKVPTEARLMIFEYALEEFKSTEERHPPTYNELLREPTRVFYGRKIRLQGTGMLAGFSCN